MTGSDEQTPTSDGSLLTDPLLTQLSETQLDLLGEIFRVVYDDRSAGFWPLWDYVSRELCRDRTDYLDTAALWASLPRVPRPGHYGEYGLVWHSGGNPTPNLEDSVGLSLAGLAALAGVRQEAGYLANDLAYTVGALAAKELEVKSSPSEVADTTISLDVVKPFFVARGRTEGLRAPVKPLTDATAVDLLTREYAVLAIGKGPDGGDTASLNPFLRRYRNVNSASEYLAIIAGDQRARKIPAPQLRPDELALMLDYLSFVLSSHPEWNAATMANPPDYRTVASLSLPVQNEEEFHSRMSDLWTVLDNLNVPEAPPNYAKDKPKSLFRLQLWLQANIMDETSKERVLAAMRAVRGIGAVRSFAQHPHLDTRKRAQAASMQLDLEFPIRAWGTAWDTIRARVADALYTISQEARP